MRPVLVVAAALASLLAAAPARADGPQSGAWPEIAMLVGGAFAPSDGLSAGGTFEGGLMMGGSALWDWADRFRFGVGGFAADFGSEFENVVGLGGSETPQSLGDIETEHRKAWTLGWRVDVLGPRAGGWGRPFGTVAYQAGRVTADQQGRTLETRTAVATTLFAGWERALGSHYTLALSAGPTFMSAGSSEHFTSAQLEWRWRP